MFRLALSPSHVVRDPYSLEVHFHLFASQWIHSEWRTERPQRDPGTRRMVRTNFSSLSALVADLRFINPGVGCSSWMLSSHSSSLSSELSSSPEHQRSALLGTSTKKRKFVLSNVCVTTGRPTKPTLLVGVFSSVCFPAGRFTSSFLHGSVLLSVLALVRFPHTTIPFIVLLE